MFYEMVCVAHRLTLIMILLLFANVWLRESDRDIRDSVNKYNYIREVVTLLSS